MDRIKLGKKGEAIARKFLKKQGLKILATNFRTRSGEMDIIAKSTEEIVFVEVKTRTSESFGEAVEAVDFRKKARLWKIAEIYLVQNKLENSAVRFDVVTVMFNQNRKKPEKIQWYKNII